MVDFGSAGTAFAPVDVEVGHLWDPAAGESKGACVDAQVFLLDLIGLWIRGGSIGFCISRRNKGIAHSSVDDSRRVGSDSIITCDFVAGNKRSDLALGLAVEVPSRTDQCSSSPQGLILRCFNTLLGPFIIHGEEGMLYSGRNTYLSF